MESVEVLNGIGKGKDCLIIGSGNSVSDFDFDSVPEDIVRIGLNFLFVKTRIDYNIFSDSTYSNFISLGCLNEKIDLIGFKNNIKSAGDRVDYFYDWGNVLPGGHVGFSALQIAVKMDFDNIYLIGFDYNNDGDYLHYYADHYISDFRKKVYTERYFESFLKDFDLIEWNNNIFNLNQTSRLKKFEFRENV